MFSTSIVVPTSAPLPAAMSYVSTELTVLLVVVLSFSFISCCYLVCYCIWYWKAGRHALGSLAHWRSLAGLDPDTGRHGPEEKPPRYEDLETQPPPPSYQDWKTVYWIPGVADNVSKDRLWGRANTVCEIHV